LATLADTAPVAVELRLSDQQYDAAIEAALYVAVREAIDDAARRNATEVAIEIDGYVALSISDNGRPRAEPLIHVADRVGALGGETSFGANVLHAEIPCA